MLCGLSGEKEKEQNNQRERELNETIFYYKMYQFGDIVLQMTDGYEMGNQIAAELKKRKLITTKCDGAGMPDVLVTNDLMPRFSSS